MLLTNGCARSSADKRAADPPAQRLRARNRLSGAPRRQRAPSSEDSEVAISFIFQLCIS